jgi:FAD/FMN-containing dehydrogenase
MNDQAVSIDEALISKLKQIVGNDHVLTEHKDREFYSTDLSCRDREVAAMVVQPGTEEELSSSVEAATEAGLAVIARGGGMSYTSAYTPERPDTMLLDMRRLDKVLEVNTEDMYVVVECGCTWMTLYETLKDKGVRTPYWGPLSGKYATIGGALSQNSLFHGSGVHGTVADSVIGLRVVLPNGDVLQTGSAAQKHSNGFWRHFGPDITGIFTADTGAFGVKSVATLRLIETPPSTAYMAFKFDTMAQCLEAQVRIARLNIASECYMFDPYYNAGFERQGITFTEGLSIVGKVVRKRGLKGMATAAKMAVTGKKILKDVPYSLHMTFDALTDVVANEHQEFAAEICLEEGGVEMDNTLPQIFRAEPFGGVRTLLLGPDGELWFPVHGFFPLSRAVEAGAATEAWLETKRPLLEEHDIKTSYLTCFAGPEFVIEPSFYWRDKLGDFRLSLIEEEFAEKWKDIPEDVEKRKIVLQLREELRDLFDSLGSCHLQIGKYYEYSSLMNNDSLWKVLNGVKDVLDPDRKINPGSLGLR